MENTDLKDGIIGAQMNVDEDDSLKHYGTPQQYPFDPHGSGRYREGSGETPNQHGNGLDFISIYDKYRKAGMSGPEIAKAMGFKSTTELRNANSIARENNRRYIQTAIVQLNKEGYNNSEIARQLGLSGESYVRSALKAVAKGNSTRIKKTSENLENLVKEKKAIDVSLGSELYLGISKEKLRATLSALKEKGYNVYQIQFPQVTNPKQYTTMSVLADKDITYDYLKKHYDAIKPVSEYANVQDDGDTFYKPFEYPSSIDKKRVAVRYSDGAVLGADGKVYSNPSKNENDSGVMKDGLIEVRRGVKDLNFGTGTNYCQARILVDGTHYIKGMAVYSDNLPDGVDVLFNTNKTDGTPILGPKDSTVFKVIKNDPLNPFGSAIKENGGQSYYPDPNGKFKDKDGNPTSLSLINKRADEGDWNDWSKQLPSQFLSKQNNALISRQLKLAKLDKEGEFDQINHLTNPTIRRKMLEDFADSCDTAAVNLKAAALPGQRYQVILPLTSIADDEVYAPNFKDGTKVALIRYPHGGTFEIPIVTVNNRNQEGIERRSKNPSDAIGIRKTVADRLSGADFDGDTVMVIPLNPSLYKINSTSPLKGLVGFDPTHEYGADKIIEKEDSTDGKAHYFRNGIEFKKMSDTQNQMGRISNLITDMTLQYATADELARAVRHSMVVIDAEKHNLDWKQSEIDNGIPALKKKYQNGGASTLISRAKGQVAIRERKEGKYFTKDGNTEVVPIDSNERQFVNPDTAEIFSLGQVKKVLVDQKTGKKLYHDTGKVLTEVSYKDSDGKTITVKGYNQNGKIVYRKQGDDKYTTVTNEKVKQKYALQKSTQMAETDDAFDLSRGTVQEKYYAEYANARKAMAGKARLEALMIQDIPYSPSARKAYLPEVESLSMKYKEALLNAPRERQAQLISTAKIQARVKEDPDLLEDKDRYKKMKNQILAQSRGIVGAKRNPIKITDREWQAIQSGAIAKSFLNNMLKYIDNDRLMELASPKKSDTLAPGKQSRLRSMARIGYTNSEIADALGISVSTVVKYLSGKEDKK